jgi:pentose-5-phosphate-3-epimerase
MMVVRNKEKQIHVMIVTPAYSGTVHAQYAISLAETYHLLMSNGIKVSTQIEPNGSLLVASRNRLTEMFWQSDATHMLCVDSDLGWPAQAVLAMLETKKEFIAGVYPARKEKGFTFRPKYENETIQKLINENHLIKMEGVPAGFMLISKTAIKKMRNYFSNLYYSPKDPRDKSESTYALFNTELIGGQFWGEDYVFCKRAAEAGIEIWVDPLIQFDHAGTIGSLIEILSDKPNVKE